MIEEILDDVIELSQPVAAIRTTGLYFLFQGNRIVYIGQSNACEARINMHIAEGIKEFDRFTIVKFGREGLRRLERELIECFRPLYNGGTPADKGLIRLAEVAKDTGVAWHVLEGAVKQYRVPYDYNCGRDRYVKKTAIFAALKEQSLIP